MRLTHWSSGLKAWKMRVIAEMLMRRWKDKLGKKYGNTAMYSHFLPFGVAVSILMASHLVPFAMFTGFVISHVFAVLSFSIH